MAAVDSYTTITCPPLFCFSHHDSTICPLIRYNVVHKHTFTQANLSVKMHQSTSNELLFIEIKHNSMLKLYFKQEMYVGSVPLWRQEFLSVFTNAHSSKPLNSNDCIATISLNYIFATCAMICNKTYSLHIAHLVDVLLDYVTESRHVTVSYTIKNIYCCRN